MIRRRQPMKKHKKTRANAGETLVEVTASIFLFLIMMGILQGAIAYSNAALAKNKQIRSDNVAILAKLQNTTSVEGEVRNLQFVAVNSDLTVKGNAVFQVPTILGNKTLTYTSADGQTKNTVFYIYGSTQQSGTSEDGQSDGGEGS